MGDDTSWNEPGHCLCGWAAPSRIELVHEDPGLIPDDVMVRIVCPVCGSEYAIPIETTN